MPDDMKEIFRLDDGFRLAWYCGQMEVVFDVEGADMDVYAYARIDREKAAKMIAWMQEMLAKEAPR